MFTFKQFVVHQDKCGMKVCIDSCIFGASVTLSAGEKVLDIGTGTGLLSLMLAQKAKVKIDAVEIDKAAFEQASQNFRESLFSEQIQVYHTPVSEFTGNDYDVIICNPPFYSEHLASPNLQRQRAMHQGSLLLEDLGLEIERKLKDTGGAYILLPPREMKAFEKLMTLLGFSLQSQTFIKHSATKAPFREIGVFSKQKRGMESNELIIREPDNVSYTAKFQTLMKDYYIIF